MGLHLEKGGEGQRRAEKESVEGGGKEEGEGGKGEGEGEDKRGEQVAQVQETTDQGQRWT